MPRIACHPDRGPRAARPVRRQGRRRAGPDPDRAGDPRRDRARHRRTHDAGAGAAAPAARSDRRKGVQSMTQPLSRDPEDALNPDTGQSAGGDIIRCDACPVLCRIRPGRAGACDRYANQDGVAGARSIPLLLLQRRGRGPAARWCRFSSQAGLGRQADARRRHLRHRRRRGHHLSGLQAGAVHRRRSNADGVDMVTVVTEGIFSYCGVKVKIDTDRHLGPEAAAVRVDGEQVGHVTTAEYGSQMLVARRRAPPDRRLARRKATSPATTLLKLVQRARPSDLTIDGGHGVARAGRRGADRRRRRRSCACASAAARATIGIFAQQWLGHVDEVIVVDDHITGVLTEHQAGKRARHAPGRHPRARAALHARALFPGRASRAWAGAAPTSPIRLRSSSASTPRRPGRVCAC